MAGEGDKVLEAAEHSAEGATKEGDDLKLFWGPFMTPTSHGIFCFASSCYRLGLLHTISPNVVLGDHEHLSTLVIVVGQFILNLGFRLVCLSPIVWGSQ